MGESSRVPEDPAGEQGSLRHLKPAAMRPSLHRYIEQVADSVCDSIVIADSECGIGYANAAAERMFGIDRLHLLGRRCDDPALGLAPADGAPLIPERLACRKALATGEAVLGAEQVIVRPDGSRVFVLVNASPLRDEHGSLIGVVNSYTDITDLKRAEDSLREKDEYNCSLLRLYERLGQVNSYGAILEALRPEIRAVLGYMSVWLQLVRGDYEDLLLLDSGGTVERSAKELLRDERYHTTIHGEEFLVLPLRDDPYLMEAAQSSGVHVMEDARTHPLTNKDIVAITGNRTIVATPLVLAERKLGVFSAGTFGDEGALIPTETQRDYLMTLANHVAVAVDRVRFLGERRDAEAALRESEERYRRFIETSIEGVWALDERRRTTFVSDRMAEMIGYLPEDIVGRPVMDFVPDEDAGPFSERLDSRLDGVAESYEMRLSRSDGSPIWLQLSATPILDVSGNYRGAFAMASDITGRKHAERERERLVGELEGLLSGIVDALSSAASQRDPYTALHQERVARLACAIAEELGLDGDVIHGLHIAALLHDIGKVSVPSDILSKPGTLSDMEMGIVRTHCTIGYKLLEHVAFGRPVAEAVLQHHERLDGSGYPDGLVGEEILLEARILAVADVTEAMASFRPYRPALGLDAAIAEIEANAGIKYDPDAVTACARVIRSAARIL